MKKEVCKNVFTTEYFQMDQQEGWFDTDLPENREQLKSDDSTEFYSIYKPGQHGSHTPHWFPPVYEYVNESVQRTTRINGQEESIYVFKCFVKKLPSHDIKRYFVSEAYYVDMNIEHATFELPLEDVSGRFVLLNEENGENGSLQLVGFAANSKRLGGEFKVLNDDDFERLKKFLYIDIDST